MSTPERLVIVFVVDGLRPDAVTAEETPTLHRLSREGVVFVNAHAVFPTVTRVNAASISTGTQPGTHGIAGNQLYVPALDAGRAINTGDYRKLLALDDLPGERLLFALTLAERLHARGRRLCAVSSGSTGSAFLLNPRARTGIGALVNGYLDPGKTVAHPAPVNEAVLAKLGPAPPKPPGGRFDAAVAWTQRVLRDYVLPDLRPDVVLDWLTEPDHTQHERGVGSPEAREALRNDDREIAAVLAALDDLGRLAATDVIVVSDHGFSTNTGGVDVAAALAADGLLGGPGDGVVLASSGQAVAVHVAGRDPGRVARIARLAQSSEWGGVVFTAGRPGDPRGLVEGTFSLELIHAAGPRSPDLLLTFPWTSAPNAFGVRGADLACTSGGARLYASDHGSMSPWNVRNTLIGWGPGFKRATAVWAPAGNADVAPTIWTLLGLGEAEGFDGRVLAEAIVGGPDEERAPVETRVHTVAAGAYRAVIQVSVAGGRRYVDKSWRVD